MKIIGIIVLVLVVVIIALLMSGGSTTSTKNSGMMFSTVQADLNAGARLIDVRTVEEFNAGYVEGGVNLPLDKIQSGVFPTSAKDTKIYVYCRSGNRSAQAKALLQKAGYTNVIDLGGMNDVVSMGGKQIK